MFAAELAKYMTHVLAFNFSREYFDKETFFFHSFEQLQVVPLIVHVESPAQRLKLRLESANIISTLVHPPNTVPESNANIFG